MTRTGAELFGPLIDPEPGIFVVLAVVRGDRECRRRREVLQVFVGGFDSDAKQGEARHHELV